MLQYRILSIIGIIGVGLLFSQCKKDDGVLDSLTHFNFSTDYVVKVPASPATPFPVSVVSPEIKTHSDVQFDNNNTRADLVEQISLRQLDLSVDTPDDGTLTFLKSVDIYAIAEGLPAVRVAYKDQIPADVGSTLSLDVTNVELKEYFKRETYVLRVTVTTDEALTQEYAVRANGTFFVDAKVLGQ